MTTTLSTLPTEAEIRDIKIFLNQFNKWREQGKPIPSFKPITMPRLAKPFIPKLSMELQSDQIVVEYQTEYSTYKGSVKLYSDSSIRSLERLYEILIAGIKKTNPNVVMTKTTINVLTIMLAFDINLNFFKEWYSVTLTLRPPRLPNLVSA